MMILTPEKFYFRFGIRKLTQLINPGVYTWVSFHFPKEAIYHYNTYERGSLGPDNKEPIFNDISKKIPMKIVSELTEMSPGVIKKPIPFLTLARGWIDKNKKKFLIMNDFGPFINQPLLPMVYNYETLGSTYKYPPMPIAKYNEWKDRTVTFWKNVNASCIKDKRNHYVVLDLPDNIPSLSKYIFWSKNAVIPAMMEVFKDHRDLNLLELWKFFMPITKDSKNPSLLRKYIELNNFKKINLVLRYKNKWCMINLAYLYKWTKRENDEQDIEVAGILQNLPKERMQRALLALVYKMQEMAAVDAKPEETSSLDFVNTKGLVDDNESLTDNIIDEGIKKNAEQDDIYKDQTEYQEDLNIDENLLKEDDSVGDDIFEEADKDSASIEDKLTNKIDKVLQDKGEDITINNPATRLIPSRKRKLSLEVDEKDLHEYVYNDEEPRKVLEDILNSYKEENIITNLEYKKLIKNLDKTDNISTAYTNGPLKDFIKVTPKDLELEDDVVKLPNSINIDDASMLESTLASFDSSYIKNVLRKDVAAIVYSIQKAGIILEDYQVEEVPSVLGDYEVHTLKIHPLDGKPGIIKFRFPKMNEKNCFMINGISYRLRKQQSDLPIVKIAKNRVALSSYYGKAFVYRSEAKVDDTYEWINDNIVLQAMSQESTNIKSVKLADVSNNLIQVPRAYSSLSSRFAEVKLGNMTLDFNYENRVHVYGEENIKKYEKNGRVLCGVTRANELITVDKDDNFYAHSGSNSRLLGDICHLANLDRKKAPVEYAVTDVSGKRIPIGVILGYFMGFNNLLKLLKVKYKVFDKGKNPAIANNEWVLSFKDKKYVFDRNDKVSSLIVGGFKHYKNTIKLYTSDLFNKQDVYLNMIESRGLSSRHIKELNNLNSLFVDPITKTVLEDMNEPVTYLGLLMRASSMLDNDSYPDDLDMRTKRIRGTERVVGAIYQELTKSIREYKIKNTRGNSKIEMAPFAVWTNVSEDQSKIPVSDINPIEHIKEEEAVTMVGQGGRSKESLVARTRGFHKSHIGTISDTTVGSGDVGVNNFLCANPKFRSLRGRTDYFDMDKEMGATSILATPSLATIGIEHDDGKRANFVSIQSSHVVACKGYTQPYIRSGYESMIAHRCHEPFAITAKKPGKVISVDEYGIIIEDEDGKKGYELGTIYGASEGTYYNHEMRTLLKKGDKIEPGDAITYNEGFFEPDLLNPRQIIWKTSFLVKTALYESPQTLEDGCIISKKLSDLLTTSVIKIRDFTIEFKQGLENVVKVGDNVEPGDSLMIIQDEVTTEYNIFDKETLKSLQRLANASPRAKYKGVIDRIEVFYNGELKDMSASLRKLAKQSDELLAQKCMSSGKIIHNGKVSREYRVEGNPLLENTANVRIYIKTTHDAGVGDKGVFANQLKTTFGEVMNYEMRTESGEEIEAVFGFRSIFHRMVMSPMSVGSTNVLLRKTAEKAVKIYFGE